jgi:hypothetical protein
MKRLTQNVAAVILLGPLLVSTGTAEGKPDPILGTSLSDCSAFFGLLSAFSEGMKGFALAATSYAIFAFDDQRQAESAAGKSMVQLADEMPKLQEDQIAFKNKLETCVSILKTAELELRPRMDETMKTLVPKLFSGD